MNLQSLKDILEKAKLDVVNKKELKKDYDGRSDKDIDNDGDTDKSDEYLHLRRKAITKNMKKKNGNGDANGKNDNEVEMNPKVDNMKKSESKKSTVESFRDKLLSVIEANQTPHKDKAEKPEDNLKGAGAKQMKKDVEDGAEMRDDDRKGHDDAAKAERSGPNGKARPNDSKKGDKNIINKVSDESQKGRKDLGADGFKEELSPIASMKKLTDAFKMVLDKKDIDEAKFDNSIQNEIENHQDEIDYLEGRLDNEKDMEKKVAIQDRIRKHRQKISDLRAGRL